MLFSFCLHIPGRHEQAQLSQRLPVSAWVLPELSQWAPCHGLGSPRTKADSDRGELSPVSYSSAPDFMTPASHGSSQPPTLASQQVVNPCLLGPGIGFCFFPRPQLQTKSRIVSLGLDLTLSFLREA